MKGIKFICLHFLLSLFFVLISSPIVIASIYCYKYLDAHEQLRFLKWAFYGLFVVWLFAIPWLTRHTAKHMAFEDRDFGTALKLVYYDARLHAAFLPLVGHWFQPDTDKRDFKDDDTKFNSRG